MNLLKSGKEKYNQIVRIQNCVIDLLSITAINYINALPNDIAIEIHLTGSMLLINMRRENEETEQDYERRCMDIFDKLVDNFCNVTE